MDYEALEARVEKLEVEQSNMREVLERIETLLAEAVGDEYEDPIAASHERFLAKCRQRDLDRLG